MPQTPLNIPIGTRPGTPITTNTGTQVKAGGGVFFGFSVLTAGSAWTASVYDGTSTSGTLIAVVSLDATGPVTYPPIRFVDGLFVETAGTTAGSAVVAHF